MLALILCVEMVGARGTTQKRISEVDYKSFPFGKTEAEVLKWVEQHENVVLQRDETVSVNHIICYKPIEPFFTSGVSMSESQVPYLHNRIVRKYTMKRCTSIFPNMFRIELFFVRTMEYMAEYRLFMAWCMSRVEAGKMDEIYTDELEKRVALFGTPGNIWEGTTSIGASYHLDPDVESEANATVSPTTVGQPLPANVTLWQHEDGSSFFMMTDNGMLHFKEFLFVWSAGWGDYLRALVEIQTPLAERFISSRKNQQPAKKQ
jgi:hypothetical protein